MEGFREKLLRFMQGRNGVDTLSRDMLILYLILGGVNLWLQSPMLYFITVVLFIWDVYRMLSRKIVPRQRENMLYLVVRKKGITFFRRQWNRLREIRTHRYRKCPHCKAHLRLKRKTGEINVTCPRCREHFTVYIRW